MKSSDKLSSAIIDFIDSTSLYQFLSKKCSNESSQLICACNNTYKVDFARRL